MFLRITDDPVTMPIGPIHMRRIKPYTQREDVERHRELAHEEDIPTDQPDWQAAEEDLEPAAQSSQPVAADPGDTNQQEETTARYHLRPRKGGSKLQVM